MWLLIGMTSTAAGIVKRVRQEWVRRLQDDWAGRLRTVRVYIHQGQDKRLEADDYSLQQ